MKLNQAQLEAVQYVDGPCFVLAGAGSGKTRVITIKIEYLIKNIGLLPKQILAVTFTNKAAKEMQERIETNIGKERAEQLTICTFHSLGLEILKKEYIRANLKASFTLFDTHDQLKLIDEIASQYFPRDYSENRKELLENCCEYISNIKSSLITLEEVQAQNTNLAKVFIEYQAYLKACNAVDMDDLIYKSTLLLKNNEDLRQKWSLRFAYILVDEYQDTNVSQYQLLKMLSSYYKKFTVVGDDDQAIYSWRGADSKNIENLSNDFKDLKVIKLEQNYRSSQNILELANLLIENNDHIYEKAIYSELEQGEDILLVECMDSEDEARYIAYKIIERRMLEHCKWSSFAILFRSNSQASIFEKILHGSNIPNIVYGGESFFDRAEVKDIIAYLKLIANTHDEMSLMRIINIPRRGIGKETLTKLTDFSKRYAKGSFECAMHTKFLSMLGPNEQKAIQEFCALIIKYQQAIAKGHKDIITNLITDINYSQYLQSSKLSDKAIKFKLNNIQTVIKWMFELMQGQNGQKALSFKDAVNKICMRQMLSKIDGEEEVNAVQLMTLHSSKGLEFPYVFLVGLEEGSLPHKKSLSTDAQIQEERRLAYVGITRAQKSLVISYRLNNKTVNPILTAFDKGVKLKKSRFLDEISYYKAVKKLKSQYKNANLSTEHKQKLASSALDELLKSVGSAAFEGR